jgi:hypothetical protein
MASCGGQLVVHQDGTVAYCTDAHATGGCTGEDRPHRRGVLTCALASDEQCAYCQALVLSPVS